MLDYETCHHCSIFEEGYEFVTAAWSSEKIRTVELLYLFRPSWSQTSEIRRDATMILSCADLLFNLDRSICTISMYIDVDF